MFEFTVEDMSCGHCVATITKAIKEALPAAEVSIDLGQHRVSVEGATNAMQIEGLIRDAGYTPLLRDV